MLQAVAECRAGFHVVYAGKQGIVLGKEDNECYTQYAWLKVIAFT